MGTVSRQPKTGGGTAFVAGRTILSAEVNADFDELVTEINGNLENFNIGADASAGTGIDPEKIDDYSNTNPEAITEVDPVDTASISKATDLRGEIARLRHNDHAQGIGIRAEYHNGTSIVATSHAEPTPRGPNLVVNGGLQVYQSDIPGTPPGGTTADVPYGWTFVGAAVPNTSTLVTTPASEGDVKTLQVINANGVNEGITQTIGGLKASTKYLIGCRLAAASGTAYMAVSGGIGSGNYQAATKSTTVGTFATYSLIHKTNSTPDDIVLSIYNNTIGHEVNVHDVFCYELAKDPVGGWNFVPQRIEILVANTIAIGVTDLWVELTDYTISAEVPCSGCVIEYEADLSLNTTFAGAPKIMHMRLTENGTRVVGNKPFISMNTVGVLAHGTLHFRWFNANPVPGTTYTYKIEYADQIGAPATDFLTLQPLDASTGIFAGQTSSEVILTVRGPR